MIFRNIFKRQQPRYTADNICEIEFSLSFEFMKIRNRAVRQTIAYTASGDILSDVLLGRYKTPLVLYAIPIDAVQTIVTSINNMMYSQAGVNKKSVADFSALYNKCCGNVFNDSDDMNLPKIYQRDASGNSGNSHQYDYQLNVLCDNLGTDKILYVFSNISRPNSVFDITNADDKYHSGNRITSLTCSCFSDGLNALGCNRSFTEYLHNRLMGLITSALMFMMYGNKVFLESYIMSENLLWEFVQRLPDEGA